MTPDPKPPLVPPCATCVWWSGNGRNTSNGLCWWKPPPVMRAYMARIVEHEWHPKGTSANDYCGEHRERES